MDEVTRDIQGDIPWCVLLADDVMLADDIWMGQYDVRALGTNLGIERF
jgi:hypothetical protein